MKHCFRFSNFILKIYICLVKLICAVYSSHPCFDFSGALCGPTTDPTPKNHPSYEEMVRSVCKALGSPSQLPRESHIQANPGLCQG